MASGSDGHCPTQDRVSSSASQGGLDARICEVADTSPSLRSTVRRVPGGLRGRRGLRRARPRRQGGQHRDRAAGWASAQLTATAAPMDTPPTTMAPSRAALSSSET